MNDRFCGFTPDATHFFARLEENNTTSWFRKNAGMFEREMRAPFLALLKGLPRKHHPFKAFRLETDPRYSSDTSPYVLMQWACHRRLGSSVEYIHLDKDGLFLAAGQIAASPEQIARFHNSMRIPKLKESFERVFWILRSRNITCTNDVALKMNAPLSGSLADDSLSNVPRKKCCIAFARIPDIELEIGPEVIERIAAWWRAAEPINIWLDRNIG